MALLEAQVALAPEQVGTFRRICAFEYEKVPLALYRCTESGLRVAVVRVQSPTVRGHLTLQTEAFDDYGCPHTLEHLCFMGSSRYPYKGVLDAVANRCLCQGTNAWTDVDHTCYTVETAGAEGFLRLLPVYLDHLLFPTLKESAFITEIHHISGDGDNAGVVYNELQAIENTGENMVERALKLAMYPSRSGYRADTGGRMKELRELTPEMVQQYHRSYYRPDNLLITVTGQVDFEELCRALEPVVHSIAQSERSQNLPALVRPFTTPVPRPPQRARVEVEFPAEDEESGALCHMAWQGPRWEDYEGFQALDILFTYLTEDSVSPLQQALVDRAPALCGEVGHLIHEQTVLMLELELRSVDVEQLECRDVDAEVTQVLEAFAAPDGSGVDLERMRSLVRKKQRMQRALLEEDPHDFFVTELIGSFLYGPDFAPGVEVVREDSLRARLNVSACLEPLLSWDGPRWAKLCSRWLLEAEGSPRVTVVGRPSKEIGDKIQQEESQRLEAQKKALGDEGLSKAAEVVASAEEANEVYPPDHLVQSFPVPDVSKVKLINVETATLKGGKALPPAVQAHSNHEIRDLLEKAQQTKPLAPAFRFDHADGAQVIVCSVMLPLRELSTEQLALLQLWCDAAFELPLAASSRGPETTMEELVQALTDLSIGYGLDVGIGGGRFGVGAAPNNAYLVIKAEKSDYKEAVALLLRVLVDAHFDADRLRIAAQRLLNDIPNSKRDAETLISLAGMAMQFQDESSIGAACVFRMEKILRELVEGDEADQRLLEAVAKLEDARRKMLANLDQLLVRVAGDILSLGADPFEPWQLALPIAEVPVKVTEEAVSRPALAWELTAEDAELPPAGSTHGCLITSTTDESAYLVIQCEAPTDPESPDLAPLMVALEYLDCVEGPFWRRIRGRGLAYGFYTSHNLETGRLKFTVSRSNEPLEAFREAAAIVQRLCWGEIEQEDGEEPVAASLSSSTGSPEDVEAEDGDFEEEDEETGLNPEEVEAAKSGVLFSLIGSVDTASSAMSDAFLHWVKREPEDQVQRLLKAVQEVTCEDVQRVMSQYVLPLFDGSKGRLVSMLIPQQRRWHVQRELAAMSPPFRLCQFQVDELATAVSAPDGFAALRAKVRQAGEDTESGRVKSRFSAKKRAVSSKVKRGASLFAGVHGGGALSPTWGGSFVQLRAAGSHEQPVPPKRTHWLSLGLALAAVAQRLFPASQMYKVPTRRSFSPLMSVWASTPLSTSLPRLAATGPPLCGLRQHR